MNSLPIKITLAKGTKRQLYVDRGRVKGNMMARKMHLQLDPTPAFPLILLPCLIIRNDDPANGITLTYCDEIEVRGPSRFVCRIEAPLTTEGPAMWIETEAEVELTIL